MALSVILIAVYAAIVFVGGLMGFLKAGSKPSLFAGVGSAALLAGAFWLAQTDKASHGLLAACGVALLLTFVFLMRFLKTRAFMPSGMMLGISFAATVYFGLAAHGIV